MRDPRARLPDRRRAALLVIDMQEYFRPLVADILPRLARLAGVCRAAEVPVLLTQHGHVDAATDGGMLAEWWSDLILRGSPEAEILPELAPTEPVIAKNRYSAFHGTDLDARLRNAGVAELIVGGVMTNLCCETTARDAFVRDYRVFFLTDGTAAACEEHHEASLTNLAYGFAHLVGCEQVAAALASG